MPAEDSLLVTLDQKVNRYRLYRWAGSTGENPRQRGDWRLKALQQLDMEVVAVRQA